MLVWSVIVFGQTQSLHGTISNYPGGKVAKVDVAVYQSPSYNFVASAAINTDGSFNIVFSKPLSPAACQLWFETGDSILFIAGSDKDLNFKARWYENQVIEASFAGSVENEQLWQLKAALRNFKSFEDSIGYAGRSIDEFDAQYLTKSQQVKDYYYKQIQEFNKKLNSIKQLKPESFCSRAILPAVFKANRFELAAGTGYDNERSFQHFHFFDLIDAADSLPASSPFLRQQINTYMELWVNQNEKGLKEGTDLVLKKFEVNSTLKNYALATLTDYFTERNNFPLVDYLYETYYNTCEAPHLEGRSAEIVEQMKQLAPGNKAPELIMPDAMGNYFWLSQMKTDKYVVLFFWASWCPHCQKAMPEVLDFYHKNKDKGIDFVAVSLDSKKEDWLGYINRNKLDWTNISDLRYWDSEAVKLYALRATPTFYVLDGSLHIIKRTNEFEEVKKILKP